MVQIKSVRQNVAAPQSPIMGGALQGLAGFANNYNTAQDQNKAAADKLNLSLLTAYANQDRTITQDPAGAFNYGGKNYAVGDKAPDYDKMKTGMENGFLAKTLGFQHAQAQERVAEIAKKDPKFIELFNKARKSPNEQNINNLNQYKQTLMAYELGILAPEPKGEPGKVAKFFNKAAGVGTAMAGLGFDAPERLRKGEHLGVAADAVKEAGLRFTGMKGPSMLVDYFKKKKAEQEAQENLVPQSMRSLPLPSPEVVEIDPLDWNSASSEEQRLIYDSWGIPY